MRAALVLILSFLSLAERIYAQGMLGPVVQSRQQIATAISANDSALLVVCDGCQLSPPGPNCVPTACNLTAQQIIDLFSDTVGNAIALEDQRNEYSSVDSQLAGVQGQVSCNGPRCFNAASGSTMTFPSGGGVVIGPPPPGGGFEPPPPENPDTIGQGIPTIDKMLSWLGLKPDEVESRATRNKKSTAALGVKTDGKGKVFVPGKGWVDIASLGTDEAMKAAGFSDHEIGRVKKAKKAAAKAKKKADRTLADRLKDFFRDEDSDDEYEEDKEVSVAQKRGGGPLRPQKPSLAGLSRAFGSDQIGISQDNIFQMVNRCYQQQRKSGQFLEK